MCKYPREGCGSRQREKHHAYYENADGVGPKRSEDHISKATAGSLFWRTSQAGHTLAVFIAFLGLNSARTPRKTHVRRPEHVYQWHEGSRNKWWRSYRWSFGGSKKNLIFSWASHGKVVVTGKKIWRRRKSNSRPHASPKLIFLGAKRALYQLSYVPNGGSGTYSATLTLSSSIGRFRLQNGPPTVVEKNDTG